MRQGEAMNPTRKWSTDDFLEAAIWTPMGVSILAAFVVLLIQCINWLKSAQWHWIVLADSGLQFFPKTGLVGLDKILLWLFSDLPLFVWLLVVAPVIWRCLMGALASFVRE